MSLKQTLSRHWFRFQRELFPWLEEALGPLGERYERLVRVVELVRVEEWLPYSRGWRGRPLEDLPKVCDIGVKRNAKGHQESWTGYKLHIDAIDGGIPVSCLLTSASVHDSQAAIPLARLTASRVDSLYDLMDSAYDAPEIRAFSQKLGHVPIIDLNPRRRPQVKAERKREALAERRIGQVSPEARRTRERSTVERVNGRLKDEFGGRYVRVRGPGKVWCHLMFGILALTVEQLMRLTL